MVVARKVMFGRGKRALKRAALLLPLLLTAAALLLLPRPQLPRPSNTELPSPKQLPYYLTTRATVEKESSNDGHMEDDNDLEQNRRDDEEIRVARRPWYMRGGKLRPEHINNDNLFPEETNCDRIESQLMYALPEDLNPPIKKILIANGLSAFNVPNGRQEFLRNKCPVAECSLTGDPNEAATADAILFKDQHTHFNVPRPLNQIWIIYYLECPYHTTIHQSKDAFNWTATYRRDSDIVAPYEKWVYHDPLITQLDQGRNYAANKTGKVAWFVSNCHARNRRLQYALHLSKHISVDIYGGCGKNRCPRNDPDCFALLDKKYKFYLAFENSNCKDYITEKFFVNGLGHNSIPIVMGARAEEYEASAPYHSYIHVEDFKGPKHLAEYLHKLDNNEDQYNAYFKWKGTGEFINTYFFCRVCAMLHASEQKKRTSFYADIHSWWNQNTCTRNTWRSNAKMNKTLYVYLQSKGLVGTESDSSWEKS